MKIAYVSNYLNHHTEALCKHLYQRLDGNFVFIETEKNPSEESDNNREFKMGYAYYFAGQIDRKSIPWCLKAYSDEDSRKTALDIINSSDAVIIANASDDWIMKRLKAGGLTFRAHERWYKKGLKVVRFPRAVAGGWLHHGRFNSLYLLSASAYTAADAAKVGCFRDKAYRWGYFPDFEDYTETQIVQMKSGELPTVLWAGRFVDWKHAEAAIEACSKLLEEGYQFELRLAGTGPEDKNLRQLCENCGILGNAEFLGKLTPEQVRGEMEAADIFLLTSNFQEGWGVVLNEAMNSACAVVASHAAGATPYLLKNGENGLIYKSEDLDELQKCVRYLLKNPEKRLEMGLNAYKSIKTAWTPDIAAERLIHLCQQINTGKESEYKDGPCSKAPIVANEWWRENEFVR